MRPLTRPAAFAAILALVVSLVPVLPAAASMPPPPAIGGVQLNDVQFLADGQHGWAAGGFMSDGFDYGAIDRTSDGGATWVRTTVDQFSHYIRSISFATTSTGYAVDGASLDKVYKTTDGGATWTVKLVASGLLDSGNTLEAVRFTSATEGIAVGQTGDKAIAVWSTTDGGDHWTLTFKGPEYFDGEGLPIGDGWFHSVAGYDATHLVGVGEQVWSPSDAVPPKAVAYRYEGSGWTTDTLPAGVNWLNAVAYASSSAALAVGGPSSKVVKFNGSAWSSVSSGVTTELHDVALPDATHGWVVGELGKIRFWNGTAFAGQTSGTTARLRGVHFTSITNGWAVGDSETILHTTNGGTTWTKVTPTGPVVGVEPIQGDTRFDTAIAAVDKAFPGGASTVVIAWGRNFPDALGASALCGAYDAPLLLTETGYIPLQVRNKIASLGATHAVIIGSETVVSKAVADDLATLVGGPTHVERIYGPGRYDTASRVATTVAAVAGARSDVFLAVGDNFPDALAASPKAFAGKWPILLTARTGLSGQAADALTALNPARVHILGSTGAVPQIVEDQLHARFPAIAIDRWASPPNGTRYATAVDIANRSGLSYSGLGIATGENFPDALAGGVMQGKLGGVVLLTPTTFLHADTAAAITAHKPQITVVRYLGSTSAVGSAVRTRVSQLLQ